MLRTMYRDGDGVPTTSTVISLADNSHYWSFFRTKTRFVHLNIVLRSGFYNLSRLIFKVSRSSRIKVSRMHRTTRKCFHNVMKQIVTKLYTATAFSYQSQFALGLFQTKLFFRFSPCPTANTCPTANRIFFANQLKNIDDIFAKNDAQSWR